MATAAIDLPDLPRDLRKAATTLSDAEARYLVDTFYLMQEQRKRAANQVRALGESEEPHDTVGFFLNQTEMLEGQVGRALDAYSAAKPLGVWARTVHGIGPVIAAGLLAHIDISRAPTVGHIWRFAGLDPSRRWHGMTNGRELVSAAWQGTDSDVRAMVFLARSTSTRVTDLYHLAADVTVDHEQALGVLRGTIERSDQGDSLDAIAATYPHYPDNLIRHACEELDLNEVEVYAKLYDGVDVKRSELAKAVAKRPWNASLKVLCWKIGTSFAMFSADEKCVYGHAYRDRKAYEVERDERGGNADTAKRTLEERRIQDKDTRATYEAGKLPAGRLDQRARRWATKLFLAHYHHVGHELLHHKPPPRPYVLEHLGHTDYAAPPNWPMS